MSNPLTFLRQLDYTATRAVLLVQTGPAEMLPGAVARLREAFPGCAVDVVVHESDAAVGGELENVRVEVARPGRRRALVGALRCQRYDVVAMLLVRGGLGELGAVPFLLRARTILALNQNLDHFPITVHRLGTLAQHLGVATEGSPSPLRAAYRLARRALGRLAAVPLITGYLLLAAGWIHLRGFARRRLGIGRRGRAQAPALPS